MWSTESKGVTYNIKSATPCGELKHSQTLSLQTPWGLCPSFSDPSAAGEMLQQACNQHTGTNLFYMWLFDTTQQERHYGLVAIAAQ